MDYLNNGQERRALSCMSKLAYLSLFALGDGHDLSHHEITLENVKILTHPICGCQVEYGSSLEMISELLNNLPGIGRAATSVPLSIINNPTTFCCVRKDTNLQNLKVLRGSPGSSKHPFELSFLNHQLQLSGLVVLELEGNAIRGSICELKNIRSLQKLSLKCASSHITDCSLENAVLACPHLQHLELSGSFVSGNLKSLIILGSTLEVLILTECPALKGNISTDLQCLTKLKKLSLSSKWSLVLMRNIEGDINGLAYLKCLESVSFRYCDNIEGDLSELSKLKTLSHVNLTGCSKVTCGRMMKSSRRCFHVDKKEEEFEEEEEVVCVPPGRIKVRGFRVHDVSDGYVYSDRAEWTELMNWIITKQSVG
jgi:hypothetical protein